jgi:hypothetical protein
MPAFLKKSDAENLASPCNFACILGGYLFNVSGKPGALLFVMRSLDQVTRTICAQKIYTQRIWAALLLG